MSDRAVGGSPITGNVRASKVFKRGRICAEQGCGTLLSVYNSGKFCYQHEPRKAPRTRGKKVA